MLHRVFLAGGKQAVELLFYLRADIAKICFIKFFLFKEVSLSVSPSVRFFAARKLMRAIISCIFINIVLLYLYYYSRGGQSGQYLTCRERFLLDF